MTGDYRLTIAGPVSRSLSETVRSRFDGVSIVAADHATVLRVTAADQPALRALLTLLWDVGHDVVEVRAEQDRR